MAVKIKLKRLGRTRVPTYRIVVADARTKRDGRAIEEIGKYHPKEEPSFIEVNSERAQHWLSVGAQPTAPVMNILKITGDWQKFKGEPGAEGTLRTREPAADKKEVFADALKSAGSAGRDSSSDSGATTPKGGGRARKSDSAKPNSAKPETAKDETAKDEPKAESRRGKPKAGSADESAGAAASSEAPAAEAKAAAQDSEPGSEA
ncbi:MAG TPA: 30S ribosomal protein S16 [Streptosporangiaceae bacterium]|nr:30S ribosomal protein S16 [Streptosporangiaceae bacterium]